MKNAIFIQRIVQQYYKYNLKDKSDAATQAFIEALHKEGIVPKKAQAESDGSVDLNVASLTFKNPDKSIQNIAVALFKYGISVCEISNHSLYSSIMNDMNELKFELEEKEREAFFNAFKSILSQIKEIKNHEALLKEIDKLFDLFLQDVPSKDEYKAKIFIESGSFLTKLISSPGFINMSLKDPPPGFIKALQTKPELGDALLLQFKAAYSKSMIIMPWSNLLEKNAINIDAKIEGQYYFEYVVSGSSYDIEKFVTSGGLKFSKGKLLSLPHKDGTTPLQQLAHGYEKNKSESTLGAIKICLEDNEISIAHEKNQFWLEILLQQVNTPVNWEQEEEEEPTLIAQIIDAIPAQMCQEFVDKGYYKRLKQQLVENLQKEIFWFFNHNVQEQNVLLSKAILKIEASAGAQPDAFDETVQSFNEVYQRLLAYRIDRKKDDSPHDEYLNIYAIVSCLEECIGEGMDNCNTKTYRAPPIKDGAILKKATRLFIENAFINLAKDFSPYKNSYETSGKFAAINKNIEHMLAAYGLDVDEILLSKTSKNILKNMLINMLMFESIHRDALDIKIYKVLEQENKDLLKITDKIGMAGFNEHPENAFSHQLISTLIKLAKDYRTVYNKMKSNNAINLDCTEYFTKNISEEFLSQPHFIIAIKCILRIIDYRISSFTEGDKYEKGFYADHLKGKKEIELTSDFKAHLKDYKLFFVAQLNLSLRKLALSHYKGKERAQSLKNYLTTLKYDLSISANDLDENAQAIYAHVENIEYIDKLKNDDLSEQYLYQLNTDYAQHKTMSDKDAKKLIDLLVQSAQYTQMNLYGVNFIAAAVQKRCDYLLEKLQHNKPVMTLLWLHFLRKGYTSKVEFQGKHLLGFADEHNDPARLANTILNNNDFKELPVDLKHKILGGAYPCPSALAMNFSVKRGSSTDFQVLGTRDLSHYGPKDYTGNFQINIFIPIEWLTLSLPYDLLIKNMEYTLLQQLAVKLYTGPGTSEINSIYMTIVEILKILQTMNRFDEENTCGHWIEILLVVTSPLFLNSSQLEQMKKYVINEIFPLIAKNQPMLEKFFDNGLANKICDFLQKQYNFIATASDAIIYELYFRFLSILIFTRSRRYALTNDLFKSVTSQLMFYPDVIPAFELMYLKSEVYAEIKFKDQLVDVVKEMTQKDALVPHSTKEKLCELALIPYEDTTDTLYTEIKFICMIFNEFLFSSICPMLDPTHLASQKYEDTMFFKYLRQHQYNMTAPQKKIIEVSVRKSFDAYCFLFKNAQEGELMSILHFLSLLIDTLKLDPKNILPNRFSQYHNDLIWANAYNDKKYPAVFSFEQHADFLTLSSDAVQIARRDRFMKKITQNHKYENKNNICYNESDSRSIKDKHFIKAIQMSIAYAFKVSTDKADIAFYQNVLFPFLQELKEEGFLDLPLFSKKKLFLVMLSELKILLSHEEYVSEKYKEGEIDQRVVLYVELLGAQALMSTMQEDMPEYVKGINVFKNPAAKTILNRFNTMKEDAQASGTHGNTANFTYMSLRGNNKTV